MIPDFHIKPSRTVYPPGDEKLEVEGLNAKTQRREGTKEKPSSQL
jgi:hypothetical protein